MMYPKYSHSWTSIFQSRRYASVLSFCLAFSPRITSAEPSADMQKCIYSNLETEQEAACSRVIAG